MARPSQVSTDGLTPWMSGFYSYDAAGNFTRVVVNGTEQQFKYDALNAAKSLRTTGDLARIFLYDANDERVATIQCAPDGTCDGSPAVDTWTIRDLGGKVLREYEHRWDGNVWTWKRDYVHRGGTPLATVEPVAGGGERILHLHTDHLGTVRQITDAASAEVAYHSYYPFGEQAMSRGQDGVKLKFTGHERDDGAAVLDNMHARHYVPPLGRFTTVDPILQRSPGAPQRLVRYAYARNSPLLRVDPDGRTDIHIIINREIETDRSTIGTFTVAGTEISGRTLELTDKDSKPFVSRIPAGRYFGRRGRGATLGSLIWLQDVPERTDIAIHAGNVPEDIRGCILVGCSAGEDRVNESRKKLTELLTYVDGVIATDEAVGEETVIIIDVVDVEVESLSSAEEYIEFEEIDR